MSRRAGLIVAVIYGLGLIAMVAVGMLLGPIVWNPR